MKKVSKKQKRVRDNTNSSSKATQTKATVEKSLIAKALHLLLDGEHFDDRAAAERLRQFPSVPRKIQSAFPHDVKIGFAGHYKKGKLEIQNRATFVPEFVSNSKKAWYRRKDKRGNRKPKREASGLLETNVALSTGLSMVLADLVREGMMDDVRSIMLVATDSGMKLLCERTGYLEAYLSLHPDAEGTVSTHFGLWPIDPEKHELIGRSANGKKGRKGLRTLGDCYISILRHHRAIGLHADLVRQPEKNRAERDPDDWAVGEEMDRVVRREIGKLPNGPDLLKRAEEYQREAAEDWLKRYRKGKAGTDKQHVDLEAAHKRIAELEATVAQVEEFKVQTKSVLQLILEMPVIDKLLRSAEKVWKEIEKLAGLVGLTLSREPLQQPKAEQDLPAQGIPTMAAPAVDAPAVVAPAVVAPAVVAPAVVAPAVVAPAVDAPAVDAPDDGVSQTRPSGSGQGMPSRSATSNTQKPSKESKPTKGGPTMEM